MKSKLGAWSFAFAFLLSLALPASAGYIQVVGPEASYDAGSDTFSVSGNALIGSPSICCGSLLGTGYQSLIAHVDNNGVFSGGTYSLFGTLPGSGINTATQLITAQVSSVSIHAAATNPANPTAGGGISMNIGFSGITVASLLDLDPNLGNWGLTASYCCDVGNFGSNTAIATPQAPWASSWSGYFASDYSDIRSVRALPEPNGLALAGLALAFAVAGGRTRSVRSARRSLR